LTTAVKNHDSPAVQVGGTSDHVHALFRLSKNRSPAEIVDYRRFLESHGIEFDERCVWD
jgi:hypothetical protein